MDKFVEAEFVPLKRRGRVLSILIRNTKKQGCEGPAKSKPSWIATARGEFKRSEGLPGVPAAVPEGSLWEKDQAALTSELPEHAVWGTLIQVAARSRK